MKKNKLAQTIAYNYDAQKVIFRWLVSLIIVLCILYAYLIASITFDVLARKSLETNAKELDSQVGQLELQSIALSQNVNSELGKTLGFVDAPAILFASRSDTPKVAIR